MKISIITATYNSAATVRDTLESVMRQTYQDWELIIEDGASQDDTLAIVREYEARSNGRIHVYSEQDNGLYVAMNRGIAHATGEVIGVLNSDDFYYDEYVLEDINQALNGHPIDCIYGNLVYVLPNHKGCVERIWKGSQHQKGAYMKGWHPAHPTFYARRECYEKWGGFNPKYEISADFELMLRFLEVAGFRNQYVNRYFVKMRMGGESTGSIHNIITGNKNIIRALHDNGFKPSRTFLLRRLMPKAWNMLKYKIKNIIRK